MVSRLHSYRTPLALSVLLVVIASFAGWQGSRAQDRVGHWTADEIEVAVVWSDLAGATIDHVNHVLMSGTSAMADEADISASSARLSTARAEARSSLETRTDNLSVSLRSHLDSATSDQEPPEIFAELGALLALAEGPNPVAIDLTRAQVFGQLRLNAALAAELVEHPIDPPSQWMLTLQIPLSHLASTGGLAAEPIESFGEVTANVEQLEIADPTLIRDLDRLMGERDMTELQAHNAWIAGGLKGPAPAAIDDVQELSATIGERMQRRVDTAIDAARGNANPIIVPWSVLAIVAAAAAVLLIAAVVRSQAKRTVELERIADEDPLTGVANRRSFQARTDQLMKTASDPGHIVAALDLDRFKEINDEHGHGAGDLVLKTLASRCETRVARWAEASGVSTAVARVGGDEFLVSVHQLGDDPVGTAFELAGVLQSIDDDPIAQGRTILTFSVSVGVAVTSQRADLDDIIEHADRALYAAKTSGKGSARVIDVDNDPARTLAGRSDQLG